MNHVKLKLLNSLKQSLDFSLEIVFPKECVGCGKEKTWLCEECSSKIIFIKSPTCPICSRLTSEGEYCPRHKKGKKLKGVYVAAYYKEGALREAIHAFKYEFIKELAKPLGQILSQALCEKIIDEETILMPMALHPRRERQRGFNQAKLIAQEVSRICGLEISEGLRRVRHTKRQVDLNDRQRAQNVADAFAWNSPNKLHGKKVLLIDDVMTTGATLNEAAKALKTEAHAKEVWGLVLAKG